MSIFVLNIVVSNWKNISEIVDCTQKISKLKVPLVSRAREKNSSDFLDWGTI